MVPGIPGSVFGTLVKASSCVKEMMIVQYVRAVVGYRFKDEKSKGWAVGLRVKCVE